MNITDDMIENACDDLRLNMQAHLANGPNDEDDARIRTALRTLETLADLLEEE